MLAQRRDPNLRAYYLWGPFLQRDNEESARTAVQQCLAPETVHFWVPSQKLSTDLSLVLRLAPGRVAWDVYLLYRRGITWDKIIPAPSYWQHQLDVLQGEKFNIATLEVRIHQALQR